MKDFGIDVASFERLGRLRIVDWEEWFLAPGRQAPFRSTADLLEQFAVVFRDAHSRGCEPLLIISESDMLVRKGYLGDYEGFEKEAERSLLDIGAVLLCAYDERELSAIKGSKSEVALRHTKSLE